MAGGQGRGPRPEARPGAGSAGAVQCDRGPARRGSRHIKRWPAAKLDWLALLGLQRLHSRSGSYGGDIAVPRARARSPALARGGDEGAELGIEGRPEPFGPIGRHPAHERAVRLDDNIVALGEADRPALADDLAADI